MPSDLKKMIEGAMPGWTTQDEAAGRQDAKGSNWSAVPDQTGVDFDELKRKYLPTRAGLTYSSDTFSGQGVAASEPHPSGSVALQRVRPKAEIDSAFGSKTVVVDRGGRGIVGKQG